MFENLQHTIYNGQPSLSAQDWGVLGTCNPDYQKWESLLWEKYREADNLMHRW